MSLFSPHGGVVSPAQYFGTSLLLLGSVYLSDKGSTTTRDENEEQDQKTPQNHQLYVGGAGRGKGLVIFLNSSESSCPPLRPVWPPAGLTTMMNRHRVQTLPFSNFREVLAQQQSQHTAVFLCTKWGYAHLLAPMVRLKSVFFFGWKNFTSWVSSHQSR